MRGKIIIVYSCILSILIYTIYFINKSVVENGVQEIEYRQVQADMLQVHSLMGAAKIRLKQHTYDWSSWDEAYDYMENNNYEFILRNLNSDRLKELHITAAAFYNLQLERLTFIDGSELMFGEAWVESEGVLFDRIIKMVKVYDLDNAEGFVNVNGVDMLVAVRKVYDSENRLPYRGYLVLSSALDVYFKERAYSISGLRFSFLPMTLYNLTYAKQIHDDNFKILKTENEIRVYSIVNDIFGEPAFCLELQRPRDIAAFGEKISHKNFWLMVSLCVILLWAGVTILSFAYRRFLREEMNYRAKHDTLTGLPNGALFLEKMREIVKKRKEKNVTLGLLYIDIDKFKSINDCYGYQQGDRILREVAKRLSAQKSVATLARTSVDNFYLVIEAANQKRVDERAEEVLEDLNRPFAVEGNNVHVSSSIGLVYINEQNENDVISLMHYAELAMYHAKEQGGNTIAFYDESMINVASSKKRIEIALYEAIEKNAFTVYYQPKVDVSAMDVAGCEALIRWQKSDGSWVPPPVFIPVAEETGVVTHIDMFVLRTACRQVLAWQKDGSGAVPIAVNMSVRSILSEGFAEQVIDILKEEGTPPSLIDIEITETSFMSDMEKAYAAISRLHEAGIHIALDDFGTGYSSLQYLSAMPITYLKIDRKFVDDIFSGRHAAQPLVKSIIALAASLGMHTICEGVEDKNQLAFLIGNGAHIIQGYFFSKPLSAENCSEYLRNRKAHITSVM